MEFSTMELKKRLAKIILLTIIFVNLVSLSNAEPQANKPYKVCPEIVTAKDTPCKVLKPTATIAVRLMEAPKTPLEQENERLKALVEELTSRLKELIEERNVSLPNN